MFPRNQEARNQGQTGSFRSTDEYSIDHNPVKFSFQFLFFFYVLIESLIHSYVAIISA